MLLVKPWNAKNAEHADLLKIVSWNLGETTSIGQQLKLPRPKTELVPVKTRLVLMTKAKMGQRKSLSLERGHYTLMQKKAYTIKSKK